MSIDGCVEKTNHDLTSVQFLSQPSLSVCQDVCGCYRFPIVDNNFISPQICPCDFFCPPLSLSSKTNQLKPVDANDGDSRTLLKLNDLEALGFWKMKKFHGTVWRDSRDVFWVQWHNSAGI
ncbi:hypothetical protein AVEN_61604-1 [Araneus ventricosus]|uniref:Uncharacterized protein n=1 Tax=Araneus ventricosus TaxID=182803 RepID=A0A4Y2NP27_ARAVE|nr:hypothetical protein AVEN_61604-1 [Araneus ventricosus]